MTIHLKKHRESEGRGVTGDELEAVARRSVCVSHNGIKYSLNSTGI
jgi:hypothetical protein